LAVPGVNEKREQTIEEKPTAIGEIKGDYFLKPWRVVIEKIPFWITYFLKFRVRVDNVGNAPSFAEGVRRVRRGLCTRIKETISVKTGPPNYIPP